MKKRANALLAVQRTAALGITSAYRTVSGAAVLAIAGMILIDLCILERRKIWMSKQQNVEEQIDENASRQKTI